MRAQDLSRILHRDACHLESGPGFCTLVYSIYDCFGRRGSDTLASTAWMIRSVGEQISHAYRATGLCRVVESRNDLRDYSLATPSVGHKQMPIEPSVI